MSHVTPSRVRSLVIALPLLAFSFAACGGGDGESPPVPSHLEKTAGDGVSASVASTTSASPTLKVTDENGRAIRGVVVNFVASGGGSIAASVDTSDASGIATSGAWTLGTSLGQQTVTATSPQIAGVTATFTATATPGPSSQLVFITQPPVAAQSGVGFQGPVVEFRDRFGNRTSSTATVALSMAGDQGPVALNGTTAVAAVDGRATFGTLSTTGTGVLSLIASSPDVASALSTPVSVAAGPPSTIVKLSGDIQLGDAGTNVFLPPQVKVTDAGGNASAGVTVNFSVVSGSGSVSGAVVTGADGIAKLASWTLGPSAGDQVVRATAGNLTADFTATALPATAYHIELRYVNTPTRRQQQAFEAAWQKWRSVIIGDLPDVGGTSSNVCGTGQTFSGTIDDLIIYVNLKPIDGPNQVLGSAGPCGYRTTSWTPALGVMTFDTADLPSLESAGQLDQVIIHEMGHVLGFGDNVNMWPSLGLNAGVATDTSNFKGAAARAVWQTLGGPAGTSVPIENCVGYTPTQCGTGTRDSHWRERTFNNELMTGYLNGGSPNPLSALTIAALQDMGYQVDMSKAESYALPATPAIRSGIAASIVSTGSVRAIIEGEPTWTRVVFDGKGSSMTVDQWKKQHPR